MHFAYAADPSFVETTINKFMDVIVTPIVYLMFGVALLVFVYGVFEFNLKTSDSTGRETGKKHMFYGIIGMFIMVSAIGLVNFIIKTLYG